MSCLIQFLVLQTKNIRRRVIIGLFPGKRLKLTKKISEFLQ